MFTLNAGIQSLTKPSGLQQKPITRPPLSQPKPPSALTQRVQWPPYWPPGFPRGALQSTPTEQPEQTCGSLTQTRSPLYSQPSPSACPVSFQVTAEVLLSACEICLSPDPLPPSLTSLTSSPTLLHPHSPLGNFSNTLLPQGFCTCCSSLTRMFFP